MNHDFLKVSLISPKLEVGNPAFNMKEMKALLANEQADVVLFPELGITGYSCGDLFFQKSIFVDALEALKSLIDDNPFPGVIILGAPLEIEEMVLNCAIVIQANKLLGVVPKFYLPNTKEYYEKRWFKSGFDVVEHIKEVTLLGQRVPFGNLLFTHELMKFGVEVCEDMWATITPGNLLSVNGASVIFNISASNETLGKSSVRKNAVLEHSRKNCGIYVYCSAGATESTSETVFSGHNIVGQNGRLIKEVNVFSLESKTLTVDLDLARLAHERRNNSSFRDSILKYRLRYTSVPFVLRESNDFLFEEPFDQLPYVPKASMYEAFEEISNIQEFGLAKRLKHIGVKHIVVGVSGGLDSSLALLVAARAFDHLGIPRSNILAYTMPGLHTSKRTKSNAYALMKGLGVQLEEINISDHVLDHLKMIKHDTSTQDITYENAQARARTMVLMNLANMHQAIVLGTGDLSEIALGWSTYNGDQMSMYNVNGGIPKTVVRFMIKAYADYVFQANLKPVLYDILDTPITPELANQQRTEDVIGKYEINDFILYRFLQCGDMDGRIKYLLGQTFDLSKEEIDGYVLNFFKRFYQQQFKRTASPDAPKVFDVALSPRSDFRMPSDVKRYS